jgi:hypothetical protein
MKSEKEPERARVNKLEFALSASTGSAQAPSKGLAPRGPRSEKLIS